VIKLVRQFLLLLLLVVATVLSGCSTSLKAVVTDNAGQRREISHVSTDRGSVIEVLDGPAYRKIPLNKIQNLLIRNSATASRDGELYYATEVWLTDSTKVLSYLMPNGQRTEAYVNVTGSVVGKTPAGSFAIPFKDVRQLKISSGKN
jgi:hypothetical protein